MKTDWKDDIFEERKIQLRDNGDDTVTPVDKTIYTQQGDAFGAKELNEIGEELNELKKSGSDGKTLLAAAITAKKVAAAATDTLAQLADKIGQIVLGSGNATAADVLEGKTFTNSTGVEQPGTMPDKSGSTQSATPTLDTTNYRLQLTIPVTAKYSTASKIYATFAAIANLIGLTAAKLIPGNTILGIASSVASMGAQTLYPGTTAKTLNSTGVYLTGNVTVPAVSIAAAYIKKGQVIAFPDGSTVTGTWEGYVGGTNDLYYLGANSASFTGASDTWTVFTMGSTFIQVASGTTSANKGTLTAGKSYQFAGFTKLNMQFYVSSKRGTTSASYVAIVVALSGSSIIGETDITTNMDTVETYTISFSLTAWQTSVTPSFTLALRGGTIQIQRIWLS